MKYFLDTNIILILFLGRYAELRPKTLKILGDAENIFVASSISLNEMIQLYRKKKIKELDYEKYDTAYKFLKAIVKQLPVKYLEYKEKHAFITSELNFVPNHNDPNDLAIIAHAMGEKATLISTDKNFPLYQEQGTKIIHNQR